MTLTRELVRNVLNTSYNDFNPETIEYAKLRIMDTVGALLSGINSSGADMMLEMARSWGGIKESNVLGTNCRLPVAHAAMVMGVMARSNDFEPAGGPDINSRKSPGHYSATSVPTALAVSQKLGRSGKDLLTALILGDDLACRIGAAGAAPWDIGWDPGGTTIRFAAAAIAGKLMGLNEKQILNAVGIVYTQISGTMLPVLDYTHSFKINQGMAAWNGIVSADLAGRGFTGPEDCLESSFGYFQQFCRDVDKSVITKNLGKRFYGDEEFKMFPCCRGNASAIETALKLVQDQNIESDQIEDIQVEISDSWKNGFLIQPFRTESCAQATAILNLYYNVANVFLRKEVKLEHFREAAVKDPEIERLISKIRILPVIQGKRLFSRITVKMNSGRVFSEMTENPRGDHITNPFTAAEFKGKFFTNIAFSGVLTDKQAEKAYNLLRQLESLKSIDELIGALTPLKKQRKGRE